MDNAVSDDAVSDDAVSDDAVSDDAARSGGRAVEPSSSLYASGVALAICGTCLFAMKSIFIKLAFAQGATPILLLSVRMLLALPFYVFVLCRSWHSDRAQSQKTRVLSARIVIRSLVLGFLGYYLASFLDLWGLTMISAQLERMTLFTYPVMVAVLAWMFLGEQLSRRVIAAIALCYAGVLLMYGKEHSLTSSQGLGTGVMLVIGAALSYSLYILFAKPTMQVIGSRAFTALAMIGSTFFVALHYLSSHHVTEFLQAKPIVFGYGVILAFVCTVLPSFMINEAIVRIGATRTTVIGTIGPVLTMLLAIVLLKEPTSAQHFAGMGIAVIGVSLIARR